eukprot:scaffold1084_cov114-Isochrysis_galbana.AAC.11
MANALPNTTATHLLGPEVCGKGDVRYESIEQSVLEARGGRVAIWVHSNQLRPRDARPRDVGCWMLEVHQDLWAFMMGSKRGDAPEEWKIMASCFLIQFTAGFSV